MPTADASSPGPLPLPFVLTREQMIRYTQQVPGRALPDRRPKVADGLLQRLRQVTCEQAWSVLRQREGVVFIPAHLAQEVAETSELIRLKDQFGYERLKAGVYSAGQIDAAWTEAMARDFQDWARQQTPRLPPEQRETLRSQPWY